MYDMMYIVHIKCALIENETLGKKLHFISFSVEHLMIKYIHLSTVICKTFVQKWLHQQTEDLYLVVNFMVVYMSHTTDLLGHIINKKIRDVKITNLHFQ